jgi:tripartite-type tricarboxylate transporter receptor subunit TctC
VTERHHETSTRRFLHLAAGVAALPTVSRFAWAQAYPARSARIIVGFGAGGASDIVARVIGQWLSERLGQQFAIENLPGPGTNIAAEAVVRAPPDGYTLLSVTPANAINATLYNKLNFDFIRDIVPVGGTTRTSYVMEVNPSVPATTVPEFIAYATANPGKVNMASSGNGTGVHLVGELFMMMTGVNMVHMPYPGLAPALTALVGGRAQVIFADMPPSIEYIKAGKLRALAVTTMSRSEALPDVSTVAEFVPGFDASLWLGLGAPKNTPTEIVAKLNREINTALADSKVKARFADLGYATMPMTPAEFGKFLCDETDKWGKVIRAANIKPD